MDPAKRKRQGKHLKHKAALVLKAKRRAERLAEAVVLKSDDQLIEEFIASGKMTKIPEGRADGVFSSTLIGGHRTKLSDL